MATPPPLGCPIYLKTERGEEDKNTIVVAMISTAEDAAVDTKAEERETQRWNVVDVIVDDLLTPHFYGDDTLASNGDVAVVGKRNVLVVHTMVQDEGVV